MLASTTKYALKALLYLSKESSDSFIQVSLLARRSRVPGPYLAKIMKALGKSEIVVTRKGAHGGIKLTRAFDQISLYEVCVALKDPIVRSVCILGKTGCNANNPCPLHAAWSENRQRILRFLHDSKISEI